MSKAPYKHLYLVDGSGYIFRAFFALRPMTRPDGTPVNAVFGFTKMLLKLVADSDADAVAVIFDAGRKSFRNDFYPQYKAHRPEAPEELVPQFPLIREATEAYGLPAIEMAGYEADDIIATYARLAVDAGVEVTIVSSDKDLMQLVRPGVTLLDPVKEKLIGPDGVVEKFGVPPEKVIDVQALAGDSVDNVPGVPGIGIKTAAQLINDYGDLESLLARAGEIKQPKRRESLIEFADQARVSRRLVELKDDVPVTVDLAGFGLKEPEPEQLKAFLLINNFKSLLEKLAHKFGDVIPDDREAGSPEKAAGKKQDQPQGQAQSQATGYVLVDDEKTLKAWVAEATAAGLVAVDTETTGLDAMRADLVGVSLATAPGRACYIPLGHKAPGANKDGGLDFDGAVAPKQIELKKAIALLKPLLEDDAVLKVGQNIKYDMTVLARHNILVAPIDDTMLLSYALDGGIDGGHGMDALSERHLSHQTIKFTEVAGSGRNQVTFDYVALDKALDYAAEDADVTLKLHQRLKPRLLTEHMTQVYETLERPLVGVLLQMEMTGIKVDPKILQRMSNDFAGRIAELETEIHKLAGRSFTIGSPKQLGEILFEEMGLKGGKKGKSGAFSTGHDVLADLAAEGHVMPQKVLDWRQLSKLKSTYTDALQTQIDPADGRVHTSYSQAIASTGRLSSNDPNLQNIPIRSEEGRKIRTAFIAEKGHQLLSVDYSQIELRLAAEIADETALKEAFHHGADIHAITASQVFNVPLEGMDPMVRRQAKAINFGIIYGMSAFGLAQNLGIPQGEARDYIEAYFARYPRIKDYMEQTKKSAREKGYVETLFGRRIHFDRINSKNPAERNFQERAAINAPIQGTAADIIKRAMIRLPARLAKAKLGARMLLQVHDELLFEVPDKEIKQTSALVREVMEKAVEPVLKLSVPIVADAGVGASWAEAH